MQSIDWELLQTTLLQFDRLPTLSIQSNVEDALRWLVKAVAEGSVLQPMLHAGMLELIWEDWALERYVDILSVHPRRVVDGTPVELGLVERFEFTLAEATEEGAEAYVRSLLEQRSRVGECARILGLYGLLTRWVSRQVTMAKTRHAPRITKASRRSSRTCTASAGLAFAAAVQPALLSLAGS